jgi:nitroimidazol reductase NimA-like FMN-containing flavoprotein (pyridoxamine 5'-phosphate oxidase superfamily)
MPDSRSAPPARSLAVLNRAECLALLATVPVGQVVFSHRALPEILPMNFRLDGDGIVIRVASGSTLARTADGTVLAFHADRIEVAAHAGWSVTVVGRASEIVEETEQARVAALPLESWLGDGRDHFLRIAAERVTGRRLG